MQRGQHPHRKTVTLIQIQKTMMKILNTSQGKKYSKFPFRKLIKKKKEGKENGGPQPLTLCEATALPKL